MAEATQMVILSIGPQSKKIHDLASTEGKTWAGILNWIRTHPGYKRLYWGLQVETPENVQLHIVKESLETHYAFLASQLYKDFLAMLAPLTTTPPTIRHAQISEFSSKCTSLGKGAPVTGTAIYLDTDANWDAAWALWSTIVPNVPGFMGIAGGKIVEEVNGKPGAFIALVGWENVDVHDAYHHTQHFRERRRILLDPAKGGFTLYGHLAFESSGLEGDKIGVKTKL